MQRKWIIPLAFCILLLIVWFFRWEQGPTQTDKELKIIHLRDRWTGQAWISLYGQNKGVYYSGEMIPIPSSDKIESRKAQIMLSPEIINKKQNLENKINDNEIKKKLYEDGHYLYERIYEESLKRDKGVSHLFDLDKSLAIMQHKYDGEIEQKTIDDYREWESANTEIKNAKSELTTLPKQIEEIAISELKTWAWQERKIATEIWAGLLTLPFIITVILFIKSIKSDNQNNLKF